MSLLRGKKGLVFGVANDRSIALHVADQLIKHGATCGFVHFPGEKNERRTQKALEESGMSDAWMVPCNVCNDSELDAVFAAAREKFDVLDFVVHSVAYADRAFLKVGSFTSTPRDVFAQALDISAYSLLAIAQRAREMMPNGGGIRPGQGMGGLGRGRGGRGAEQRTAERWVKERTPVITTKGSIIGKKFIDGEQVRGEVGTEAVELFSAAERDATDALNKTRIPNHLRKAVKNYFSQFRSEDKDRDAKAEGDSADDSADSGEAEKKD